MFTINKNRVYDSLDFMERTNIVGAAVRDNAWRFASGFVDRCFPDWGFINPRLKEFDRAMSLGPARGRELNENRNMRRAIFFLRAAISCLSGRELDLTFTAAVIPAETAEQELRNLMQRTSCAFLQAKGSVAGLRSSLESMLEEPVDFLRYNQLAIRGCTERTSGKDKNPAVCYFTYNLTEDRYEISCQCPDNGIAWGFQADNVPVANWKSGPKSAVRLTDLEGVKLSEQVVVTPTLTRGAFLVKEVDASLYCAHLRPPIPVKTRHSAGYKMYTVGADSAGSSKGDTFATIIGFRGDGGYRIFSQSAPANPFLANTVTLIQ